MVTDFALTGRLARFGRGGMIEDVSNKMVGDFVECLRSSLEAQDGPGSDAPGAEQTPPPRAEPVRGGRLFFSVLWARIKRLFGGGPQELIRPAQAWFAPSEPGVDSLA